MPAPNKAVTIDKPETPPHLRTKLDELWDKMEEGERFFSTLNATVQGMASAQKETQADVRELRGQMSAHEKLNAERSLARETSEREMRGEISALRESTAKGFKETDARLDRLTDLVGVLVDRQPTPETPPPQGPITAALGLPPRQARPASTAAVAGGGLGVAGVLTLIGQLASLPVAAQWALGVVAVMVALTACWVVGVRMTRRD